MRQEGLEERRVLLASLFLPVTLKEEPRAKSGPGDSPAKSSRVADIAGQGDRVESSDKSGAFDRLGPLKGKKTPPLAFPTPSPQPNTRRPSWRRRQPSLTATSPLYTALLMQSTWPSPLATTPFAPSLLGNIGLHNAVHTLSKHVKRKLWIGQVKKKCYFTLSDACFNLFCPSNS